MLKRAGLRCNIPLRYFVAFLLVFAQASVSASENHVVEPEYLNREIAARLRRVEPFEYVRRRAEAMGVRVWIFGGSAAAFAHYVRWNLESESGGANFSRDRFDYDFAGIYRSTQDVDIVIDGDPAQSHELSQDLEKRFPHLEGSKPQWEVRTLRHAIGHLGQPGFKEALLDNPDFINQHTDSNSTAMIELTYPVDNGSRVRDLRDWNRQGATDFLKDVASGQLTYYFSELHQSTPRYKLGINPPIFSVIRFLTKAFQYELHIGNGDMVTIRRLIAEFDPDRDLANPESRSWLERNASKLIQHAVNIEYAVNTLDVLGLRKRLISLGDPSLPDTAAWWLSKEPLRTSLVGQGEGKTALELGISEIAHEAADLLAYESITRAHTGDPNAVISRANINGETASYGNGFYTRIGSAGARGTGFTIRLKVVPEAREGSDFFRAGNDFVVVINKAAVRVIPESLNWTPLEYFEYLDRGERFDPKDLGIIEMLKRRVRLRSATIADLEMQALEELVLRALKKGKPYQLIEEWFLLPRAGDFPAVLDLLLSRADREMDQWLVEHVFRSGSSHLFSQGQLLDFYDKVSREGDMRSLLGIVELLPPPLQKSSLEMIKSRVRLEVSKSIIEEAAGKPKRKKKIVDRFLIFLGLYRGPKEDSYSPYIEGNEWWAPFKAWLERPISVSEPEIVRELMRVKQARYWVMHWMKVQHWVGQADIVIEALSNNPDDLWMQAAFGQRLLTLPGWETDTKLTQFMINTGIGLKWLVEALGDPRWASRSDLVEQIIEKHGDRGEIAHSLVTFVLTKPQWTSRSDFVRSIFGKGAATAVLVRKILLNAQWIREAKLIEEVLKDPRFDIDVLESVLKEPASVEHPEWLLRVLRRQDRLARESGDPERFWLHFHWSISGALRSSHWENHPVLIQWCGGMPSPERVRRAVESGRPLRSDPMSNELRSMLVRTCQAAFL